MKRRPQRRTKLLLASVLVLTGTTSPVSAQTKPAWEGVYTEAQALRGRSQYVEICGYCHRDDLSGGGSEAGAPALRGPFFTNQWQDRLLVDLFITIGTTMPQHNPDSLMPQAVIDIVSYLLWQNGLPSGRVELPPVLPPLERIRFTARPD